MRLSFVIWSCIFFATPGTKGNHSIDGLSAAGNEVPTVALINPKNFLKRKKRADECGLSHTVVDGKSQCQGKRVFHDSFLGENINSAVWNHEIFMPSDPNYEFVVFDKDQQTSWVRDGRLHIKPSPYEDEFVKSGRIQLSSCTGQRFSEECEKTALGMFILPPIQSARITTKDSFSFKYGKVQVRAKLPIGDWILPEIWLEPKENFYGRGYSSGRIRIAFARGNKELKSINGDKIGVNLLQCGVIMGTRDKIRGRFLKRDSEDGWHNKFHNYTLIWEPNKISFMIDDEEKESLLPTGGRLSQVIGFDQSESDPWLLGSTMAPFDQEFYISIGLSVGGMKDFPDDCVSGDYEKPWKNDAVKGMLKFWQARDKWQPTWNKNSIFQIEHVTVHALNAIFKI